MIEIKNLTKRYNGVCALNNISLRLDSGKITVILGESGAGKTTLLNCLSKATDFSGEIIAEVSSISYVFQTDRLIKNLTAEENLKLVLGDIDLTSAFASVGLSGQQNKLPKQLSAGMKRRVALLRAFLYPSNLMLMDEPFINLDISNKIGLIQQVKELNKKDKKTVVMVTHDVDEAILLADRIIILKDKKIALDITEITANTRGEILNILVGADKAKVTI